MDGNKKITGIVFAGIIALAITACKFQSPGYVGLFVDNSISVTDTADHSATTLGDAAMPHYIDTTPQLAHIISEPLQAQPLSRMQSDTLTLQVMQAQNDTILFLRSQLYNIGLQAQDTTLIVALYERGAINPLEEDSVLKQVKELCSNEIVTKIMFSGYTDSSGSEIINQEITNRRLNYLSEKIIPWIGKEKIFFQNFGGITTKTETLVGDERRIEIRILTK